MALGPQAEMFSWGRLALEGDSIGSSLLGLQVLFAGALLCLDAGLPRLLVSASKTCIYSAAEKAKQHE